MGKEITELEQQNTWIVVKNNYLPCGANPLPSTWAFKIEQYPDGRMQKQKAKFFVRGDCQIKNLVYFESYAPVVLWSTIRMVTNIVTQSGWATRKVNSSNAFIQAKLEKEVNVELPALFSDGNENSKETVVLKLIKSLYRIVQALHTGYQHLQKGLKSLEFDPSNLDREMYHRQGMIVITDIDD